MAIPYYRFFPGDYSRDTRHLSLTQHGVYRLLIDLYMDTGGPLRNDLSYLHRWLHAESIEERNAVEFVLGEFFLLKANRWTHKRCDIEIAWRISQSRAGKQAASARESKKLETTDHRSIIDRSSNQNQNQNQGTSSEPFALSGSSPPFKKNKTTIPKAFGISPRVLHWAEDRGIENLEAHLTYFVSKAKAKGYKYVDWDEALMGAIRDDWAKIGDGRKRVAI